MGHVTSPRLFHQDSLIVVRRLGLPMINLHTKFEVSMFTYYEDMTANTNCRNSGRLGVRCHPKSSAM